MVLSLKDYTMAACDFLQIFDYEFYSRTYLENNAGKSEALEHYTSIGSALGYKPHALFDVQFYCQNAKIDYKEINPLEHYLQIGYKENLSPFPLFDPVWYAKQYEYDKQNMPAFVHYIQQNKNGNYTDPNEFFDTAWYKKEYDFACSEYEFCVEHYLSAGKNLPYNPSKKFFALDYALKYTVPHKLVINPLVHYLTVGRNDNCTVAPVDMEHQELRRFNQMNKIITQAFHIHFHLNDKFFNPTVKFINNNFNKHEHAHLWVGALSYEKTRQIMHKDDNICNINYGTLDVNLLKNKKLYFHSLFIQPNVTLLYYHKELLKHSYWLVWGGDFYSAPTDEMNTFVRNNIYGIGSFSDNDKIKKVYGENHKFFETNLAMSPINIDLLDKIKNEMKPHKPCVTIQINNSSDKSTIDMLNVLSKFKDKKIEIRTVLSYGDTQYNEEIIQCGKEIFGDKFSYLDKILRPEEYAQYLAENDIFILNQDRQQGGANACASLYLGQKVFVKSTVTTANYLHDNELIFFDSLSIPHLNWLDFISLQKKDKETNRKMIEKNIYNRERFKAQVQEVFDDDCFSGNAN